MEFPDVILLCKACGHEVFRSDLENGKWIHLDDEFFLAKQAWKYDHEADPNFIEGDTSE